MPEGTNDIKNHYIGGIVGCGRRNIPIADGSGVAVQQPADEGNRGQNIHIGLVLLLFFKNFATICDFVSSSDTKTFSRLFATVNGETLFPIPLRKSYRQIIRKFHFQTNQYAH
jgi:hypothetical protein